MIKLFNKLFPIIIFAVFIFIIFNYEKTGGTQHNVPAITENFYNIKKMVLESPVTEESILSRTHGSSIAIKYNPVNQNDFVNQLKIFAKQENYTEEIAIKNNKFSLETTLLFLCHNKFSDRYFTIKLLEDKKIFVGIFLTDSKNATCAQYHKNILTIPNTNSKI